MADDAAAGVFRDLRGGCGDDLRRAADQDKQTPSLSASARKRGTKSVPFIFSRKPLPKAQEGRDLHPDPIVDEKKAFLVRSAATEILAGRDEVMIDKADGDLPIGAHDVSAGTV